MHIRKGYQMSSSIDLGVFALTIALVLIISSYSTIIWYVTQSQKRDKQRHQHSARDLQSLKLQPQPEDHIAYIEYLERIAAQK